MWIDKSPYWFKPEGVKKIEALKDAIHMGHWCTKGPGGNWNESPVDVFYVANPDTSQGHTNYFGMFYRDDRLYITNGASAFSEPITGVLTEDGEVLVSRYRHDYLARGGVMVDGGRDYLKCSSPARCVNVLAEGSEFRFEVLNEFGLPTTV